MTKIGIIGAGAWGTALAQTLVNTGKDVLLWVREAELVSSINQNHENSFYLKNIPLHKNLKATGAIQDLQGCDIFLLTCPAQHVRSTLENVKNIIGTKPLIICAKGIEITTGDLLTDIVKQIMPDTPAGVLTGPTFASEIARGLPCAVTVAFPDKEVGEQVIQEIGSRTLRTYLTDDVVGAQVGGAVKNVIAIASGVIHGKAMGESARCALVTRGLAEMARLAKAMGAKRQTLMGMCGVGDLILTCSSMQSRNFSLGVALGEGKSLQEILGDRIAVTEGVHTAKSIGILAKNYAVDMPISSAVHDFLYENLSMDEIIERVLDRPLRNENI